MLRGGRWSTPTLAAAFGPARNAPLGQLPFQMRIRIGSVGDSHRAHKFILKVRMHGGLNVFGGLGNANRLQTRTFVEKGNPRPVTSGIADR